MNADNNSYYKYEKSCVFDERYLRKRNALSELNQIGHFLKLISNHRNKRTSMVKLVEWGTNEIH